MLINADCLEYMKTMADNSVDAVITDPPYGTTSCKWDSVIPFEPMWEQLKRIIKPNGAIVLFGSEPFSSALRMSNIKQFRYDWVWDKNSGTNFMSAQLMPLLKLENASVFSRSTCNCMSKVKMKYYPQGIIRIDKIVKNGKNVGGKVAEARGAEFKAGKEYKQEFTNYPFNLLNYKRDSSKFHPTQKPVALMEYLIKTYTNENETVLDFTMGSGSTGVACKKLNRNFIGIELDTGYFEIAKNRIENSVRKLEIF